MEQVKKSVGLGSPIRICPMEERHIKELARLEALCFSAPWSEEGLGAELQSETAVFFVAEKEKEKKKEVLGYAGMHTVLGECYIDNIAVFPQYRGMGVGRMLTESLISWGKEHDALFITLEARSSNSAALGLYGSLGFQEVGRRKGFYSRPREDALILTLYF